MTEPEVGRPSGQPMCTKTCTSPGLRAGRPSGRPIQRVKLSGSGPGRPNGRPTREQTLWIGRPLGRPARELCPLDLASVDRQVKPGYGRPGDRPVGRQRQEPKSKVLWPVDRSVDRGQIQRVNSLDRSTARSTGPQAKDMYTFCAYQSTDF